LCLTRVERHALEATQALRRLADSGGLGYVDLRDAAGTAALRAAAVKATASKVRSRKRLDIKDSVHQGWALQLE
jgi:hypothetical protein